MVERNRNRAMSDAVQFVDDMDALSSRLMWHATNTLKVAACYVVNIHLTHTPSRVEQKLVLPVVVLLEPVED